MRKDEAQATPESRDSSVSAAEEMIRLRAEFSRLVAYGPAASSRLYAESHRHHGVHVPRSVFDLQLEPDGLAGGRPSAAPRSRARIGRPASARAVKICW
ncbi:hypothetical protein [Streptomyces sp. NPDC056255]|uniref:hypothetical protein n=1 Tax=Streptomyces sp. NPDC056255 TaxID=3345764 RepID=UPI0035DD59F5